MGFLLSASLFVLGAGLAVSAAEPQPRARIPVLLDTDLGGYIDDAFALALVLTSPELDLRGMTTVHGDAHTRALLACRWLHALGRADVPVAAATPVKELPDFHGQMQYGLRPAFRKRPVKESAVEFLYQQLKAHPGELTLLAIGPLTNIAELLNRHPDCKPWIDLGDTAHGSPSPRGRSRMVSRLALDRWDTHRPSDALRPRPESSCGSCLAGHPTLADPGPSSRGGSGKVE